MKSLIEEYGNIIVVVIAASLVLFYAFNRNSDGYLGIMSQMKPDAHVGTENNAENLENLSQLDPLELVVETQKLEADVEYDLLSFVKDIESFGTDYTVSVIKIVDENGEKMSLPELKDGKLMYKFSRIETNSHDDAILSSYQVTYQLKNNTGSYPVKTTETYQFVVE